MQILLVLLVLFCSCIRVYRCKDFISGFMLVYIYRNNLSLQLESKRAFFLSKGVRTTMEFEKHCLGRGLGSTISPPGLPWWRSGWESACQRRGHGFEPWSGKTPHAAERLGPWATTTEPAHLEPVLRNKRGRDSEMPAHCDEEWPPLAATRESHRIETKTQHSHK